MLDLDDVGPEPLVSELGITSELAKKFVDTAAKMAKELAAQDNKKQAESILKQETKQADSE